MGMCCVIAHPERSADVQEKPERLRPLVEAGALVSAPTCGACFGGSNGILAEGEVAVATTNRNFRGRMGAQTSGIYLANSYVAAAAAVAGEIVDPATVNPPVPA